MPALTYRTPPPPVASIRGWLVHFLTPYLVVTSWWDLMLDCLAVLSLLPSRRTGDFAVRQIPYQHLPWNQLIPYLLQHQLVLLRLATMALVAIRLTRAERRLSGTWTLFGVNLTWVRCVVWFAGCWILNAAFLLVADTQLSRPPAAGRIYGWLPAK